MSGDICDDPPLFQAPTLSDACDELDAPVAELAPKDGREPAYFSPPGPLPGAPKGSLGPPPAPPSDEIPLWAVEKAPIVFQGVNLRAHEREWLHKRARRLFPGVGTPQQRVDSLLAHLVIGSMAAEENAGRLKMTRKGKGWKVELDPA